MNNFFRRIKFRIEFGLKYKLGFLPSQSKIDEYIKANGTMMSTTQSNDAKYELNGKVYSAFERKEMVTRKLYLLDGKEYAQLTVRKR